MTNPSLDRIRRCFGISSDFNEIFDAFQQAIAMRVDDFEIYRQLFWNNTLSAEEICFFGEKIAGEFPHLSYDAYVWLARVFEATYSSSDNHELAFTYYQKAATSRPAESDPYISAADCYEPDLNIPPITRVIDFLKLGSTSVPSPNPLFERLARMYDLTGNDEMSTFYRRKIVPGPLPPPPGPDPEK